LRELFNSATFHSKGYIFFVALYTPGRTGLFFTRYAFR